MKNQVPFSKLANANTVSGHVVYHSLLVDSVVVVVVDGDDNDDDVNGHSASTDTHAFSGHIHQNNVGQMGISVENLADIQFMDSGVTQKMAAQVDSFAEFSKKMLESFYNFATSFAVAGQNGEQFFPVRTLEQWFSNFERRLQQNPNFWKQQEQP